MRRSDVHDDPEAEQMAGRDCVPWRAFRGLNLERQEQQRLSQVINNIHLEYFRSGFRLIGINAISSTTIAQADCLMQGLATSRTARLCV